MTWNGRHHKEAMRLHREQKRAEAEERNAKTPPERRRKFRSLSADEQKRVLAEAARKAGE